jgi:tRNA uridine 5-carbamoylmethylation protein Kti12
MLRPYIQILVGMPGVGKSTWINVNVNNRTVYHKVLSTDDLIENHAQRLGTTYDAIFNDYIAIATKEYEARLKSYLNSGSNIVIDRTNLTRSSRYKILRQVPSFYIKNAVVFTCDKETRINRINSRKGKFIPEHILERMEASYEVPILSEGFDDIVFIDTDKPIKELMNV